MPWHLTGFDWPCNWICFVQHIHFSKIIHYRLSAWSLLHSSLNLTLFSPVIVESNLCQTKAILLTNPEEAEGQKPGHHMDIFNHVLGSAIVYHFGKPVNHPTKTATQQSNNTFKWANHVQTPTFFTRSIDVYFANNIMKHFTREREKNNVTILSFYHCLKCLTICNMVSDMSSWHAWNITL